MPAPSMMLGKRAPNCSSYLVAALGIGLWVSLVKTQQQAMLRHLFHRYGVSVDERSVHADSRAIRLTGAD